MQEFLNIVLSMPTAPFTVALAFVLLYWGFMILGVVDLEAVSYTHLRAHET